MNLIVLILIWKGSCVHFIFKLRSDFYEEMGCIITYSLKKEYLKQIFLKARLGDFY